MHQQNRTDNKKRKRVNLAFHGPQITKVTNIFRNIPIQLAFKPTYTNFTPNKRMMPCC